MLRHRNGRSLYVRSQIDAFLSKFPGKARLPGSHGVVGGLPGGAGASGSRLLRGSQPPPAGSWGWIPQNMALGPLKGCDLLHQKPSLPKKMASGASRCPNAGSSHWDLGCPYGCKSLLCAARGRICWKMVKKKREKKRSNIASSLASSARPATWQAGTVRKRAPRNRPHFRCK